MSTDSRHRRWSAASRRGVTMIEMMAVVLILALFAVLAIPRMKGVYQRNELSAAARQFAQLARYARQNAVLRNRTTELHVDFKNDLYRLVLDPSADKPLITGSQRQPGGMERIHILGGKSRRLFFKSVVSATDPFGREQLVKVRFFKNGSASASTIVVADENDNEMTIEITGATGALWVYRGPPLEAEPPEPPDPDGERGMRI